MKFILMRKGDNQLVDKLKLYKNGKEIQFGCSTIRNRLRTMTHSQVGHILFFIFLTKNRQLRH
ncbi:hypothetical protein GN958_ATG09101 [Phytophthora infestans]|uniref:Uncharacterized protein n=1 Tax=Phytophthora infestans TaxID=4787 RepID=A0A8S9UMD6_PHYIN|nr:hypothetical protein GN958_ATG09101 [Phytophthora infestans]